MSGSRRIGIVMVGALLSSASACSRDRDRTDQPVIVIPDEPARPIARRPQVQEASSSPIPRSVVFERVAGDDYEGWIRPIEGVISDSVWRPTAEHIAAAEAALRTAAVDAMARGDWPQLDLASYARQYRGSRTGGLDVLYIDLYCPEAKHLASRMVVISRGSSCFLHTAYEIESGRFRYFASNPS